MRDLPVVYTVFDGHSNRLVSAHLKEDSAKRSSEVEAICSLVEARVVPYEPAVPKCATCDEFSIYETDSGAKAAFCRLQKRWFSRYDGSGYCDEHSELRK